MELKIDKTGWKKVKLGEVAFEYSKRINDPSKSDYDRFVGSSNIGQWDFRIKSWESTSSVSSAMKLFEPNDYLLVRRSLYASDFRERAPRADFYGVCSGDILTIKENPDYIEDGFLVGILNSPDLWKYVVANASGSITRRIHWTDLANYEFLLPPKDQQAQLAELLWAMDEVVEKSQKLLTKVIGYEKNSLQSFIEFGIKTKRDESTSKRVKYGKVFHEWEMKKIKSFCELTGGNAFKSDRFTDSGKFQVLRIGNLTSKGLDLSKSRIFIDDLYENEGRFLIPAKSIVLSLTGTNGKRGFGFPSIMVADKQYLLNQRLLNLIVNPNVMLPEFCYHLTQTELFLTPFYIKAIGSANQANVSIGDVAEIELPVPTINEQKEIVLKLNLLKVSLEKLESQIAASKALQKSLINQIF